jgi:hypothetical protein
MTMIRCRVLPQWLYAASPGDMRKVIKLVADTGSMAIRRAREQRRAS